MAAVIAERPHQADERGWNEALRTWEQTDAPEGCKVEIIEGIVTVAPPPESDHNDTADELQRLLYTVIPRDWGIYQTQGLTVPGRQGLYIPDLAVIPKKLLPRPGERRTADAAELIAEITSRSTANHDRVEKLHGYADAGVPLYLLLDPWHSGRPTATLYGQPAGGLYRVLDTVKYGDPLHLPQPFDVRIDTALFPTG
ncbi:restriction endonuclease [Streptomyces sp. NRRL F-4489]|uniref:Uma2 family endonuclease n=1 Tax=Streptomyces sp. NRRL F-4489 TaxID=1609095 RepID=UPI000746E898|nr:Uma2 family endonuclease [Streptomyces sp. NRRL F-4489]KUL55190.1 restriction endonuclease [Streptomyces sp. NRRL F-4489]